MPGGAEDYDAVVVGGGPAGTSAAKHLAYQGRSVLVLDRGSSPMYHYTDPVMNYLGAGTYTEGRVLLRQMQDEARALGAEYRRADVVRVDGRAPEFRVLLRGQPEPAAVARVLLLATGVARKHPRVGGVWQRWLPFAGKDLAALYCPDCEAPLTRGKDVLVVGAGTVAGAVYTARYVGRFARSVRVFMTTDGHVPLDDRGRERLAASGFEWAEGRVREVRVLAAGVKQILVAEDGREFKAQHFFTSFVAEPRNALAVGLGVALAPNGSVQTDHRGKTSLEGVWAAGDLRPVTQQVATAVGTGNYAAVMMNQHLGLGEADHPLTRLVPPGSGRAGERG